MKRVILVGTDPSVADLYRLMAREGVDVEVRPQIPEGIIGNSPSVIMVDEFLAQEEAVLLYGAGPVRPAPAGLLTLGLPETQSYFEEQTATAPLYCGPRPYLKRKKGRS